MAQWNDLFQVRDLVISDPNENLVRYFEELLPSKQIRNVIDLGCGTGRHAFYFAGKGFPVHAVDASGNALRILSDHIKPGYRITVSQLNLQDLSSIREKYDLAVCINVLSHGRFHEIETMFREIENVVAENGILFLILTPLEFYKYVAGPATVEVEKNSFLHIDAPDGDIVHHLFTEEEVRRLLSNYREVTFRIVMEYSPWQKKEVAHMMVVAKR